MCIRDSGMGEDLVELVQVDPGPHGQRSGLGRGQGRPGAGRSGMTAATRLPTPSVILAADHRARGVVTMENYRDYVDALARALPSCDGILATAQPLGDLVRGGHVTSSQRTYLSLNRTGLAGSVFELDDRLVASVPRAVAEGWTGVKHMTRIDMADPQTAAALELLGRVLEDARSASLEALVEPLVWREGRVARDTDSIVLAAVVAHDIGAPVIKVPVPAVAPGRDRQQACLLYTSSMAVDLDVPAKYGITQTVGDSVGPGGINRALRNVPVLVDVYKRQGHRPQRPLHRHPAPSRRRERDPHPADRAGALSRWTSKWQARWC